MSDVQVIEAFFKDELEPVEINFCDTDPDYLEFMKNANDAVLALNAKYPSGSKYKDGTEQEQFIVDLSLIMRGYLVHYISRHGTSLDFNAMTVEQYNAAKAFIKMAKAKTEQRLVQDVKQGLAWIIGLAALVSAPFVIAYMVFF